MMLKNDNAIKEMAVKLGKFSYSHCEIQNEVIVAKRVRIAGFDKVGIFSNPVIQSKEDLEVYKKRAHDRLVSLQDGIENVVATITFKKPQTEPIIKNLISKHLLHGFGVKIQGSHDFITMAKYPIDENYLKDAKEGIISEYNKMKELATTLDPEKRQVMEQGLPENFIETFNIHKGILALFCVGVSSDLISCENEESVFIVDVGPIEVRDTLLRLETDLPSEIVVTSPGDVAQYVLKFQIS